MAQAPLAFQNLRESVIDSVLQKPLYEESIVRTICRTDFEGDIKKKGDTVKFVGFGKPTIGDYTAGETMTYENPQDTVQELKINYFKKYAFQINDLDLQQSKAGSLGAATTLVDMAGQGLKEFAETTLFENVLTDIANTATAQTVTKANALIPIGDMKQLLDENKVPKKGRFMILPPWMETKLNRAGIVFQIKNGAGGASDGLSYAQECGFDIYISNLMYTPTATPVTHVFAGTYDAIGYADAILANKSFVDKDDPLMTYYSGVHAFGFKVLKPYQLVKCILTWAADTTMFSA